MESSSQRFPAPPPPHPDELPDGPIHPGSGRGGDWRERAKRWAAPLVAVGLLLFQLLAKAKVVLLLLTKVKLFTTSATMLVSIAAYALIWGWSFAAGFVVLLLVHELGHVIQLRREGIEASAPMFIPFLGAVVAAKSLGDDAAAEARVGLAGPVLGTLGTLVPLGIWLATGEPFWQALAYVGFFINLFNLIPVLPLDGGRAMAALSPWVWFVGYAGIVVLTFVFPNPILLLVLLLGGWESWRRWKNRNTPESKAFHDIPARTRVAVAAVYLGLVAALALGVYETFLPRDFGDV
ncbi:site-2 protease family protein [Thermoleophilia bacterium SCSIO 60948]|nr:site-2 protease family protein [Thermoleophilia bacterium SCSIO 60948]